MDQIFYLDIEKYEFSDSAYEQMWETWIGSKADPDLGFFGEGKWWISY